MQNLNTISYDTLRKIVNQAVAQKVRLSLTSSLFCLATRYLFHPLYFQFYWIYSSNHKLQIIDNRSSKGYASWSEVLEINGLTLYHINKLRERTSLETIHDSLKTSTLDRKPEESGNPSNQNHSASSETYQNYATSSQVASFYNPPAPMYNH